MLNPSPNEDVVYVLFTHSVGVLEGRVLTYLDAIVSDPIQRKASKDIIRPMLWDWAIQSNFADMCEIKRTKLIKKTIFVQSYGTYTNEILVIVGIKDKKKVFQYLKKIKAKVDFSKWVLTDFDDWKESVGGKHKGLFCWNEKVNGAVLVLRETDDSWEYWEVLMHECHHIVQHLAKTKGMYDEAEAQAYLFEFLFHSLRRKLQGIDKIFLT